MPIDDPTTALQALNLSDERQRSPLSRFAKPFLAFTKLIAPPGGELTLGGLEAAVDWLGGKAEANLKEFVDVLAEDLKYRGAQVQRLLAENEAQRKFVADELPGLAVDALRRAEQCRAKERIGRLAKILAHAAEVGSQDGPDAVEEMMATATGLSDAEILVLQLAAEEYRCVPAVALMAALTQGRNLLRRPEGKQAREDRDDLLGGDDDSDLFILTRAFRFAERNNFDPRIGFAYAVGNATVIRGGVGVFTQFALNTNSIR